MTHSGRSDLSKFLGTAMIRNILFAILFLVSALGQASMPITPEGYFSASDLDEAFDKSNYVFVATIIGENERGALHNYKLHGPALKGSVPLTGVITQGDSSQPDQCWGMPFLNGRVIVVLFLDSMDQAVFCSDWQLLALEGGEPSLTWVADWLKVRTAEPTGDH